MELAAGSPQIRVHLNPQDHQRLGGQIQTLFQGISHGQRRNWSPIRRSPPRCRVETRFGVIDQQFEAQLARIEEELT